MTDKYRVHLKFEVEAEILLMAKGPIDAQREAALWARSAIKEVPDYDGPIAITRTTLIESQAALLGLDNIVIEEYGKEAL